MVTPFLKDTRGSVLVCESPIATRYGWHDIHFTKWISFQAGALLHGDDVNGTQKLRDWEWYNMNDDD